MIMTAIDQTPSEIDCANVLGVNVSAISIEITLWQIGDASITQIRSSMSASPVSTA